MGIDDLAMVENRAWVTMVLNKLGISGYDQTVQIHSSIISYE